MEKFGAIYYSIVGILMAIFVVCLFITFIVEAIREAIGFSKKEDVEKEEEFREVLFENDLKDYVRKSIGGF